MLGVAPDSSVQQRRRLEAAGLGECLGVVVDLREEEACVTGVVGPIEDAAESGGPVRVLRVVADAAEIPERDAHT